MATKFVNLHNGCVIALDSIVSIDVRWPDHMHAPLSGGAVEDRWIVNAVVHYGWHGDLMLRHVYTSESEARLAYQHPLQILMDAGTIEEVDGQFKQTAECPNHDGGDQNAER